MATTTKRATKRAPRAPLKGRAWVAIGLALFAVVAAIVVGRRGVGVANARDLARLADRQRALIAEKITLDRDIRRATARSRVIGEAERRLGLHVATDAQTRLLSDSMLSAPDRPDTAVDADSASHP